MTPDGGTAGQSTATFASSTVAASSNACGWYVDFKTGHVLDDCDFLQVRCVRDTP
ncbi:MAG TPA: hypothetical protein VFN67_19735 [Polyangiales bacterium]|nr:hypothetical protein [Polyangiales bacterium]